MSIKTNGEDPSPEEPGRWELFRDVALFQLKLTLDAFRDVVISPVSLVAAVFDLIIGRRRDHSWFYHVLLLGRHTEEWIDLFRQADHVDSRPEPSDRRSPSPVDAVVERLERLVVEEYEKGDLTASAKRAIQRSLRAIPRRRRRDGS